MTDLEIAQKAQMHPIREVAKKLNISEDDLDPYGKYKAKLPLRLINAEKMKHSKLVLVTAITPTPAGEGKTTVSIGLTEGLNRIGKKAIAVLREPSLGPVFGIKGGAAGGGYSQVVPMEDINLHFTGDFSAIEKANNLLAAVIDNNIQSKTHSIGIDPRTVVWKRVMDMNDRALRHIVVGLGGATHGVPREDGFNITPASEIMAILCLAESFSDLKKRIGNIYVGKKFDGTPVFARDLNVVGAMALLLKEAIKPNFVQTLENNPAILHGGPFASIAQGTNTVLATKMGLSLGDYVITEAGFGADLGAEKFLNIKCTSAGLAPDAVVIVATIRALRHHGGAKKEEYNTPSLQKVKLGIANLEKHIENVQLFGLKAVVAINYFPNDSEEEIAYVKEVCVQKGVQAIVSKGFSEGGKGTEELAHAVVTIAQSGESHFSPLYSNEASIEEKITAVATKIYGASKVNYNSKAVSQLKQIKTLGFDKMPICIVKTPKSLSDDEKKLARPTDFEVTVREFEFASGAGFVIPILGDTVRMPGLPSVPAAEGMDIDDEGVITGLS
ncbi:formate--tetrahydrofolate ligase [Capnocytophaga sp. oral taxon 326]|uniref:formate--tetrahydrofolate ligase n=1 Tax=Capnocytophaga sp. oral taxon 326 TaxID=712212 RepID=UPI0002A41CBA|nr:formate--tetrahydrofolate ligase [Capnocytophaga sp. oral taxon 326]EKY16658.1 formate--tetrahydrofolate ligase [Capnocytophaga sp. oral taxon 326 str. F0382]